MASGHLVSDREAALHRDVDLDHLDDTRGQIVATPGALEALAESGQSAAEFLSRHAATDWGSDLCEEDRRLNDEALVGDGSRILSAYQTAKGVTQLNAILLQNLEARLLPEPEVAPVELNERFRVRGELLEMAHERLFDEQPLTILESFLLLMQHQELRGMTAKANVAATTSAREARS